MKGLYRSVYRWCCCFWRNSAHIISSLSFREGVLHRDAGLYPYQTRVFLMFSKLRTLYTQVLPPVMFVGISSVNESKVKMFKFCNLRPKAQFLSVASVQPLTFQHIWYLQHLIEVLFFCVFALYQVEQVLVTVISFLPSEELEIHIEMESVLLNTSLCWLCAEYYTSPLCRCISQQCELPPITLHKQSIFIMYLFARLLSLNYTYRWEMTWGKSICSAQELSFLRHHQVQE